jgi:hypothetical protein
MGKRSSLVGDETKSFITLTAAVTQPKLSVGLVMPTQPQNSATAVVDRRVVLEKRSSPVSSPPSAPAVPPASGNNFSVQENSGIDQPDAPAKSNGEANKLSPQELERIRINRASELYRLQREKFNEMNQVSMLKQLFSFVANGRAKYASVLVTGNFF